MDTTSERDSNFNKAMEHLVFGAKLAEASSLSMTIDCATDYTLTLQLDKKENTDEEDG